MTSSKMIEQYIGNHVNIDINPDDPTSAVASMDFNEPAMLSYYDVCELLTKMKTIRRQIEWAMAGYAHARNFPGHKWHLASVTCMEWTLCGRSVTPGWERDPLIGEPSDDLHCKHCIRMYKADQEPTGEERMEAQVAQFEDDRSPYPQAEDRF